MEELRNYISQFSRVKILVLGDVMLDKYVWGNAHRISPEAPVPVVVEEAVTLVPGGAANVAMNIVALGGQVYLAGVVGDDEEGRSMMRIFADRGINADNLVVDPSRPTTLKTRIVAHNQQVARIDREKTDSLDQVGMQKLLERVLDVVDRVDAVVISDYAKGVTVPLLLREIIDAARRLGKPVVVDPKGIDYAKYQNATVIVPNKREAGQAANCEIRDEVTLLQVGRALVDQLGCEAILITRGGKGMSLFERNGDAAHLPALARRVYDVTGAGDTVAGALTLCMATGLDLSRCAHIANCAAGVVVGKVGTAAVSQEELLEALAGASLEA